MILFSVAFGKNARGVLPLNFGPLNLSGGERRLNVAITRARRQVVLFASFDPTELRAHETSSIGVKHLKAYLDLAAEGSQRLNTSQSRQAVVDVHREEIAERLRGRGLEVATDVGLSDFRVDLVVGEPGASPVMAILLDGPTWAKRSTVGDRDATPSLVLGSRLGWPEVKRVWLPAWLGDPDSILSDIEARVRVARPTQVRQEFVPLVDDEDPGTGPNETPPVSPSVQVVIPIGQSGAPTPVDGPSQLIARSVTTTTMPTATPAELVIGRHETFRPWQPERVEPIETLDWASSNLRAARAVRDCIAQVIEAEGPVHGSRLARLVAGSYGLSRVHADRRRAILKLAPAADPDGFYWATNQVPDSWFGLRADPDQQRKIDEIHIIEIANAMAELCTAAGGLDVDDLLSQAARVFGFRRLTSSISDRLRKGLAAGLGMARITQDGDYFHAARS